MRTKFLTTIVGTGMLMSLAGVATAHHSDEHTQNHHGMCTAYFSGSENGQEKKREKGNAFLIFEEGIGDYDEDGDTDARDVAAFCMDTTGGFGNPGQGNDPYFSPDDDCEQEDDAARAECEALSDYEGGTNEGQSNPNKKNQDG